MKKDRENINYPDRERIESDPLEGESSLNTESRVMNQVQPPYSPKTKLIEITVI